MDTSHPHFACNSPLGLGALTNYLQSGVWDLASYQINAFRSWSFSGFPIENKWDKITAFHVGFQLENHSNRWLIFRKQDTLQVTMYDRIGLSHQCTTYAAGNDRACLDFPYCSIVSLIPSWIFG